MTNQIRISGLLVLLCIAADAPADQSFRHRVHAEALTVTTADDVRAEIRFGQNVAARVLGRFRILDDPELNRYVNLVGSALAASSGRSELRFRFAVLDSDSVNAWSAPGGYIFVTRGALALMEDEAELAAVLAHEIAHVSERHIVNALNIRATDSGTGSGLSRLLGAGGSTTRVVLMQAVDQAVEILFARGYRQQDELDADRVATLLLAATGYDPLALKRFLERTRTLDDSVDRAMNATHPPSRQRLRHIEQIAGEEDLEAVNLAKLKARFDHHVRDPE